MWTQQNLDYYGQSKDLSLRVRPSRGGLITSLQKGGREFLYLDPETLEDPRANVRGGIPILFPICGPLRQGLMKQHGVARISPFQAHVVGNKLRMQLLSDSSTQQVYEHSFCLQVELELVSDRLVIEVSVENRGVSTMPFQFGLHPYFRVEAEKDITWELPITTCRDNTDRGMRFPPSLKAETDMEIGGLTSRQAFFWDHRAEAGVEIGYDSHFEYLVLWSLPDKPFLCLEPWTGPRFGYEEGKVIHLAPGQSRQMQCWIAPRTSPEPD
jgi:galactose mutarotase-like enzyme